MIHPKHHQTECCIIHGCAFTEADCPVCDGTLKQKNNCRKCGDDTYGDILLIMNRLRNKYPTLSVFKMITDGLGPDKDISNVKDSYILESMIDKFLRS